VKFIVSFGSTRLVSIGYIMVVSKSCRSSLECFRTIGFPARYQQIAMGIGDGDILSLERHATWDGTRWPVQMEPLTPRPRFDSRYHAYSRLSFIYAFLTRPTH
jgi:hypothetical protein